MPISEGTVAARSLIGAVAMILLIDVSLPDTAHSGSFVLSLVALEGDPVPGRVGRTYFSFGDSSLNESNDVANHAGVNPGFETSIYVELDGIDRAVALLGDPAPGTGDTYTGLGRPHLNDAGDVAFAANAFPSRGVFVDSSGIVTPVALNGASAPCGGIYQSFGGAGNVSINGSGDVAFHAIVDRPSPQPTIPALIVNSGGTDTPVACTGDSAPGTGGGTYSGGFGSPSVHRPFINDSGAVAFFARVSGGTASEGIFVDSGGLDTAVALVGDPAPGTGGGTYSGFDLGGGSPSLNDVGVVAFRALVTGGTASEGIFMDAGAGDSVVALLGDMAPETGGGHH